MAKRMASQEAQAGLSSTVCLAMKIQPIPSELNPTERRGLTKNTEKNTGRYTWPCNLAHFRLGGEAVARDHPPPWLRRSLRLHAKATPVSTRPIWCGRGVTPRARRYASHSLQRSEGNSPRLGAFCALPHSSCAPLPSSNASEAAELSVTVAASSVL